MWFVHDPVVVNLIAHWDLAVGTRSGLASAYLVAYIPLVILLMPRRASPVEQEPEPARAVSATLVRIVASAFVAPTTTAVVAFANFARSAIVLDRFAGSIFLDWGEQALDVEVNSTV